MDYPSHRHTIPAIVIGILLLIPGAGASAATPALPAAQVPTGFSNNAVVERSVSASKSAQLLAGAAADVDRVQISWKALEPTPGDYRWSTYDATYQADLARGIKPLFNLAYAPQWASGALCAGVTTTCHAPPSPAYYGAAATAAAKIAQRYPSAAGIEIWNEPNTPYYWGTTPDPVAYTALVTASYQAIKAVQPSMKVVAGATASGPGSSATGKISGPIFLLQMYEAGAKPFMDAVSVHAYPAPNDPAAVANTDGTRTVREWYADASKPIWVTESGVTTSGATPVTEAVQATTLGQLDGSLRATAGVEMVLFHSLVEANAATSDPGRGYGVVTRGLRKKPAYCTLALAWGKRSCHL